jgi:hypothetical protein
MKNVELLALSNTGVLNIPKERLQCALPAVNFPEMNHWVDRLCAVLPAADIVPIRSDATLYVADVL